MLYTQSVYNKITSFESVLDLFKGLRACFFICCVLCGLGPLVSFQSIKNTCRKVWFSIKLKAGGTYHIEPDFELFFINSYSYLLRRIYNPTRHMWWSFFVKIVYGSKPWSKSAKRAPSQMFDWVLNMHLILFIRMSASTAIQLYFTLNDLFLQ